MSASTYKITRFKAFAIHIGISLIIFLFLMILLLGYWYKPPLFKLANGATAVQIIIFVDLVLGPLLTLVVFKPGKPGLKFDISLIAIFQLSALIYGIWMVQMARPVTVYLAYDSLYIMTYKSLKESNLAKADIDKIIGLEPTYLYIDPPKNQPGFAKTLIQAVAEGRTFELLQKYAEPLSFNNAKQTAGIAIDIEKYTAQNSEWSAQLQGFMATNKRTFETTTFLPIQASIGNYFLAVDNISGEIVDYLEVPYLGSLGKKARVPTQTE